MLGIGLGLNSSIYKLLASTSAIAISAYSIGSYDPATVADFAGVLSSGSEYYRTNGTTTSFSDMFTHERNSNATMVDSDGKLKWAPHNLLTYSEDLTTARGWSALSTGDGVLPVATNTSDVNPDGAAGSTKLTLDRGTADTSNYSIYRKQINLAAETTGSIWVKASSPGDVGKIIDVYQNAGNLFLTLVNVTLTDSWQKVSSPRGGTNTAQYLTVALYSTSASAGEVSVLIWGAHIYRSDLGGMVNNPDRNDSYVPTTSSAVYLPRRNHYGWNGSTWVNKGLLLETESRTNLVEYSNDFSSGWSIRNGDSVTVVAGQAIGPDGEQSLSSVVITDATSEDHGLQYVVTVPNDTDCTISAIVKDLGQRYVALWFWKGTNVWVNATFDLVSETMTSGQGGSTSGTVTATTISSIGDGRYKISLTAKNPTGFTLFGIVFVNSAVPTLNSIGLEAYAGVPGVGINLGFVQVELGASNTSASTPSSYMPTTGATFTRAAETLTVPAAKMAWPTPNVIGPELVTNGTFDTDISGWSASGATNSYNAGRLQVVSTFGSQGAFQSIPTVAGRLYIVTVDIVSATAAYSFGYGNVFAQGQVYYSGVLTGARTLTASFFGNGTSAIFWLFCDAAGTYLLDNISVREIDPLSVSLQMQGEMTYADEGLSFNNTFWRWYINSGDKIEAYLSTLSADTGKVIWDQRDPVSGADLVSSGATTYSPGVNVPFNISGRHGSTFINGAVDGTALTEDTTPTALPDLSATNFSLGYDYMGTIALFRQDNDDWADAGIVTATSKPVNIIYPTISGNPYTGVTLTTTDGVWSGSPTITYQWLRNGVDILGATNNSYTLVSADVGTNISCRVTATINTVNTSVITNSIGLVENVPVSAIRDRNSDPILDRNNNFIEERV